MTHSSAQLLGAALLVLPVSVFGAVTATTEEARINYNDQVRPIVEQNCLECHNAEKRKGGLSMGSYGDLLEGGKDGPVVIPGQGAGTILIDRLTGKEEPQMPKDVDPLSAEKIDLVRRWVEEGARETVNSPPAPPPWIASLTLEKPTVPTAIWNNWASPVDRFVAAALKEHPSAEPTLVSDQQFARRAYLDVWGLLPSPDEIRDFAADRSPNKRAELVTRLLADNDKYAEHWMTFWNDLLRNDDGVTYFSDAQGGGRQSITTWLLSSLKTNLPYDQFVGKLLNPTAQGDPAGFLIGVNWRGVTSAAVTPWMQAAQNTAQIFLGVNLKCNACHNSFVNKWKLKDAYNLASFFSPEAKLQLYRCDVPQEQFSSPVFLYPELNRTPPSDSLADRRATVAAIFLDPRNGRLPRTLVNRLWEKLLGRGIVAIPDEMDGRPWSPGLLDWLAIDFQESGYDLKHVIATIVSSRAYQMPSVPRNGEAPTSGYVFKGPEVRRITAEQFVDAIGTITGEWSRVASGARGAVAARGGTNQIYSREYRTGSTTLTRALGRPIRDQVISHRPSIATTVEGLELVNGEALAQRLRSAAQRMLGQSSAAPPANAAAPPVPAPPPSTSASQAIDRLFGYGMGRSPTADERRLAEAAVSDPGRPGSISAEGMADLLWAVMMKPEFQLIY